MIVRGAWIAGAFVLLAGVYACRASERSGLFNNIVDAGASQREHDIAWARDRGLELMIGRLRRIVRQRRGDCLRVEAVHGPRIACVVETSGRLAAMMPGTVKWTIVVERHPQGWRLVERYRHEMGL